MTAATRVPVVVIGAGQAGLAMSRVLGGDGIDHVVLERGEAAHSWRTERWDSVRLLTPNWMSRLPGWRYDGDDPDGFMTAANVVAFLDGYRRSFDAPVVTHVTVERVGQRADGPFEVRTDQGTWIADAVVAATGACSEPHVPALAADVPADVEQITALEYRNPEQLADGGVLVVGASASGVQIADELRRSGHPVTLAIGEHVRVPRGYRGRDIHWWMDALGIHDERHDDVDDIDRARRLASLQLVGTDELRTLDLAALAATGVRCVGKLLRVAGGTAQFSGGLTALVANADLKQERLLGRIDEFATAHGLDGELAGPSRPERTHLGTVPTQLALAELTTIVWATGYRPRFSWLGSAAFDRRRRLAHDGGVGALPGLYFLGLPFMRRRKSSFIDGVGPDAVELLPHVRAHLDRTVRRTAS